MRTYNRIEKMVYQALHHRVLCIGALVALLFFCTVLHASATTEQAASDSANQGAGSLANSVRTAPVSVEEAVDSVAMPGTVSAAQRASLAAKVAGAVTRLAVTLGSRVQAGELLCVIDAPDLAAREAQAEAQLAQVRRNLERERRLLAKQVATAEAVKSLQDAERLALASLQEARALRGYSKVYAPFAGVISSKHVHEGDVVAAGALLLEVEGWGLMQLRVPTPEELLPLVRLGLMLPVHAPALGLTIQAEVVEIAPASDPNSRSAVIVLNLPKEEKRLRSGQFLRLLLPVQGGRALLVPETAIVQSGQMERVFVVEEGRARLRLVRSGARKEGRVEILSGLRAGELVIISNNQSLTHDQAVEARP